ncbi:MAG TPA: LysM peptidoglycan-binding domain-containing protein [Vicinamibacterales bacterium]
MVGIVNGSGLGLNFTSYTETMGQTGVWNQGGLGLRGTKIFINGYTGNLIVQDQDGLLATVGTDLQALRTYNSRGSFNDDNGDNWIAGFVRQAMRLTGGTWGGAGSTVAVTNEDGSERLYTWVTNRYVSTTASGPDTYLTLNAGNTLATFSDGVQSGTFDVATGRLQSWSSPTLLNAVFTYDANGRLSSMASDASATGGRIVYEYSGNLLQRVSVVDQNNIAVSTTLYAYDANGRLSRVTVDLSPADGQIADGKVYTTDYTYVVASDATNGMLRSIVNSDGTSQTFRWVVSEGTARISQSWGSDGQITDYVINLAAKAARVTQPGGFTTDFWYDGLGRMKQSHPSKGANNGVTTDATRIFFEYSSNDNQATFKDYDLGITAFYYDSDNNLMLVRDPAGNTVRRTYVNRQIVTETAYAVADPDGNGTLTASVPATTRFIYDAEGKLRFKISPEGVVTELRYSGKLPTSTITYLGGAYNVSGLTETQVPTEAQLTTWVGSTDKSRTSRVDTVYDLRGNKLSETAYASTDAAGNGLAAGQHVVAYAYDAAGRLLSMTDGINAPVTYAYDGLGRVLTRQQGGIGTSYVHQESANGYVSTVTEQNGLVTVNTYDKMGRLLGVTRTQNSTPLGTTTNYYDPRGLLYKTRDAGGVFHWYLYDERANKVAEVDGNGTVTEFRYDVSQRPIQSIVYATPLAALTGASPNTAWADPPAAPTLASIRPAEVAGKDIKRWTVYDPAGRPIKTVDGAGFVTETRYDGADRVVGTVRYAKAIDLVAFAASPVSANASPQSDVNDRVTRRLYSTEGRLLGELDAEGYLVEYRYDAAGRLTSSVRYADPTDSTQRVAGTLAQLRPGTASPKDQTTRFVYDGQNRQIGEIDAEGFVTEQLYDDRGNVVQRTRYAAALTTAQLAAFDAGTGAWRPAGTAGLAGDRTEYWHFNTLGQLDERTDADGTVTRLSYDEVGRVVSTTRAVGTVEVRTQKVRYDGLGRVVGELSARGAALLVDGQTDAQVKAIWAQYGTSYTYDEGGRKTSQSVSDGTSTQRTIFFYNEDGQVTHTINALGEVQENQYDGIGQLIKTIAYGGRLSATTFNGLNGGLANTAIRNAVQELLAQRTPGNQAYAKAESVFDYDARGLIRSTTDALGYVSSSVYDAFGQATDTTRQLTVGGTTVAQKLEYDRRGVLVARTDDVGGLNAITRTRVDAFGRVYEQIDARGIYTKTGYDRLGRVVQTTDGALVDRYTTYDAFSRVVTTKDGNGQTTTYRYDIAARTVEVTTPENIKSRVTRNRHGEVESATDGAGVTTTYAYTENGELKTTTTPLNGVNIGTGTKYDSLGRVAETTDANSTVTKYEYDNLNRVTTRTVNPGGLVLVTSYVYEDTATGSTVLTTEADGRQTLKSFDVAGRLVASTVDPFGLALTTGFELDADGRTLKVKDPNNIVTRYEYDKLGRRTAEITDDGTNIDDLKLTRTYVYDLAGRLTSSTDWTGTSRTRYAYDDANRLIYEIDPMGSVRYTEYDGEGRERRVTRLATPLTAANLTALGTQPTRAQVAALVTSVPAKDEVTGRVFDKDGRVQFSVDAMGTVTGFRYDGAGRVKQQIVYGTAVTTATWMDGTPQAPADNPDDRVTSTLYDDLGRATTVVDAEGGITALVYDNAGNLRQKTAYARVATPATMQALRTAGAGWTAATLGAPLTHVQDRVTNYRYDAAGRLRYEYDAGGYVTETVYQGLKITTIRHATPNIAVDAVPPNSADDRATSVELDKAGRVWKSVDAMSVETRSEYDKGGRLTAQTQAYGLAEATTTGYVYDDAGHVTLKTVAQGTDAASSTRYGYDALGRMTIEVEARGVALAESNTSWARNERKAQGKAEFAEQLSATDKQAFLNRYTTTHEYDAAGRRKATINAMNFRTSTDYDAFGNAVKVTDPLGNVGYFYFDKLNRVTMQVDPEGYATRTIYAAAGSNQVAKVRRYFAKAFGATTAQMPDPVTNPTKDTLTTNAYDRLDRLVSTITTTESGNVAESTLYSAGGNRFDRQVTNKVGGVAVFNTDKLGNTVKETLPVTVEGKPIVNVYEYNAFGDRTKSVEAQKPAGASIQWLERTTLYRYDKAGRMTHRIGVSYKATDPVTLVQRDVVPVELTRYDALGRVIESVQRGEWNTAAETVSGGARTLSYYNAAGGRTGQIAADGAVTLFELDASGQVVRERVMATRIALPAAQAGGLPPAVAEDTVNDRVTRQTYDVLGRLVLSQRENVWYWESLGGNDETAMGMTFAGVVTLAQKVYDANGNVLQEIDGRSGVINNYYDKIGRKVLRIDQARYAVAWDYGDLGDVATRETKYAKDLAVGAFERQDDTGKPANLRDPAQLRAAMDATGARVSETDVDRLGRVLEKRVLGVDMQYVDADGSIRTVTGNAVTAYSYNGLGNVTQIRERVALAANGRDEVVNVTDIAYDKLGRETRRQSPAFVDVGGVARRPTTDTEYDGVGDVTRVIQRGTDDAVETDDRISRFEYNANGDKTVEVDAGGNYTLYALDAMGRAATTTRSQVLRADGSRYDVVKRLQYDAMGRVIVETDVGSGEVRRTRYNAFGEVSGKGLGTADIWHETAEYNVLGKLQRGNSDGGVYKVYLYDRNGNATRQISGDAADLSTLLVGNAATNTLLNHSFSLYDKRNLRTKTVEISVSYLKDEVKAKQAFAQKLGDLYGLITLANGGGGYYTGASGNSEGPGYSPTVVGSSGGVGALDNGNQFRPLPSDGTAWNVQGLPATDPVPMLATPPIGFAIDPPYPGSDTVYAGGPFDPHSKNLKLTMYFTLPNSMPGLAQPYRLISRDNPGKIIDVSRGQTVALYTNGTWGNERFALVAMYGDQKVVVSEITATYTLGEPERSEQGDIYSVDASGSSVSTLRRMLIPTGDQVRAFRIVNGQEVEVPAGIAWQFLPDGIQGPPTPASAVQSIDFGGVPDGRHTIVLRTYRNGALVGAMQEDVMVGASGVQPINGTAASVNPPPDMDVGPVNGGIGMRFSPAYVPGGNGSVWIRAIPATGGWRNIDFSGGGITEDALGLAVGGSYEMLVHSNGRSFYAMLTGQDVGRGVGRPNFGGVTRLRESTQTRDPQFQFQFAPSMDGPFRIEARINGVLVNLSAASGRTFNIAWSELKAKLGVTSFGDNSMSYEYKVYIDRPGRKDYVAHGVGTLRAGAIFDSATGASAAYPPIAALGIGNLSGPITLDIQDLGRVVLAPGDVRRWESGGTTYLDLGDWVRGSERTITVVYSESAAKFDGTLKLAANGQVSASIQTYTVGYEQVRLEVPGASTLSKLEIGLVGQTRQDALARASGGNGVWRWSVPLDERNKAFDVYYETKDASNNVNYKGFGRYVVDNDGNATFTAGQTVFKASVLTFRPPAETPPNGFEVNIRRKGSQDPWTPYTSFSIQGDQSRWLDVSTLRVDGQVRDYEYTYRARNGATLLSSGSGSFKIDAEGKIAQIETIADRKPLASITLQGPGKQGEIVKMALTYTRVGGSTPETVTLNGVWNPDAGRMEFTWAQPLGGRVLQSAEEYDFQISILKGDGSVRLDEAGDPIVLNGGRMILGGSYTEPVKLQQLVSYVAKDAQVRHSQTYNAFGEIVEEYDDATLARAQAMVNLYSGNPDLGGRTFTLDPSAVRTVFKYNALGKLISKQEPQTFETMANGFVRRISPLTTYAYDLLGRMTVTKDANGYSNLQSFLGGTESVTKQWAADGGWRQTEYDVFGDARRLTARVDLQRNAVTEQDFDALGRLKETRRLGVQRVQNFNGDVPGAATVSSTLKEFYTYDSLGQRIKHTDTLGYVDTTDYDTLGRVTRTVSGALLETRYSYNLIVAGATQDAVLTLGGVNQGGYKRTTTGPDGRTLIDRIDYFGRTTWHQDLGGNVYIYQYDKAGQLARQDGGLGQSITYKYLRNGYLAEVKDTGARTVSRYGYDDAGNRTTEVYASIDAQGVVDNYFQADTVQYDELNRIARVSDGEYKSHDLRYEYDAVGNRRAAIATYWDPATRAVTQRDDLWYTYDEVNRFTTTKGWLTNRGTSATDTNGQITRGTQGTSLSYDFAGQRIGAVNTDGSVEAYSYSIDGYLEDVKINLRPSSRRRVDAEGRTMQYIEWNDDGSVRQVKRSLYDADNRVLQEQVSGGTRFDGTSTYTYLNNGAGALGQIAFVSAGQASSSTTAYTYKYYDSAKQDSILKTVNGLTGTSKFSYNSNGHLILVRDLESGRTVEYSNSAQGLVLQRREKEGDKTYFFDFFYAIGRRVGDVTNDPKARSRVSYAEQLAIDLRSPSQERDKFKYFAPVTSGDFDQNYEPINASYPGPVGSAYTVRSGDTLGSIAQSVWGDSAMWYLLAEANGLGGSEALVEGQVLVIPNKVTNIHNNANTFRPYNPGEVIGNVDPTVPSPPPPPGKGGCGGIGMILMVVVAVVVTIYTAGAAAGLLGATASTGATAFSTGLAVLGGGSAAGVTLTATAGLAMSAGLGVAVAAGAAIGAAVGSIASQVVGMATGNVDKFSWKAVGQSAVSAGITAGVGSALNAAAGTGGILNGTGVGSLVQAGGAGGAMVKAGVGSAVSQAIQGKWNWREVGASTVSASAGYYAGQAVGAVMQGIDASVARIAASAGAAVAGSWASSQVMGYNTAETRARLGQAFISGLGQGIGESLGGRIEVTPSGTHQDSAFKQNVDARRVAADPYGFRDMFTSTGAAIVPDITPAAPGLGWSPEDMSSMGRSDWLSQSVAAGAAGSSGASAAFVPEAFLALDGSYHFSRQDPVVVTRNAVLEQSNLIYQSDWVYDEYGTLTMPGSAPIWNRGIAPVAREVGAAATFPQHFKSAVLSEIDEEGRVALREGNEAGLRRAARRHTFIDMMLPGSPQEIAGGAAGGAVLGKLAPLAVGYLNRLPVLGDTFPQLANRILGREAQSLDSTLGRLGTESIPTGDVKPLFAKTTLSESESVGRFDPDFANLGLQSKVEASLQKIEGTFGSGYAEAIRGKLDRVSLQGFRSTDDLGVFMATKKGATIQMNTNIGNPEVFANVLLHEVRHFRQFEKLALPLSEWNRLPTSFVEGYATAPNIWQGRMLGVASEDMPMFIDYYNKWR